MKKKVGLGILLTLFSICVFAVGGMVWSKVQDDCGKCVINDTTRKCGKCGNSMTSTYLERDGQWIIYKYKCKKCSHSCIYKVKN